MQIRTSSLFLLLGASLLICLAIGQRFSRSKRQENVTYEAVNDSEINDDMNNDAENESMDFKF